MNIGSDETFEVIPDPARFDPRSGNAIERLIFNHRRVILVAFALVSIFLGWHSMQLKINANFERMIPRSHPYIQNYLDNKTELRGLGNQLRVVVENTQGDIYDAEYLKFLASVNDALYIMPGVDRPWLKSLWTPVLRWGEVTEEGMRGGPVMPERFDGSPVKLEELKANIARSGAAGRIISDDQRSSMIVVPLLDRYADSGEPIDYLKLSRALEEQVRAKSTGKFRVYIVGFGKLVGDLIEGLTTVISYFAISVAIAALFVFLYTRCLRSTVVLVVTAVLGVMWLMGLLQILGYELDPYSILVPFLLFAIGLSHGAQKMNGIMQDVGRGTHKYVAARYTFRRLFLAGLTALLTNVVGFMVLIIIDIPVIRDLAVMTSIGVTGLIFTKLVLIPVLLSYTGVSPKAAQRSLNADAAEHAGRSAMGRVWGALERLTERRWALVAIAAAALLGAGAFSLRTGLKIGDLDEGAPELRRDSRYNLDNAYIARHYGLSSDQFAVIVKTPKSACDRYEGLVEADRLGWELEHVQGVKAVTSFAEQTKRGVAASSEGYFKWNTLARDPRILGPAANRVIQDNPDAMNPNCSLFAVTAYLSDHRADTLDRVLKSVEGFAATHSRPGVEFLPAAGPAGIEAVTNIVVRKSFYIMHVVLYIAVTLLCFITFRSWRAVVVALVPLLITSILCEAIMVVMGIGVKVATLPVIALGVGVGVDYALYLLSVQLAVQRRGGSLRDAYKHSLEFTGKVVALIGVTMAAGVVTWAWSPIKFQADMGILLTFMFLWNMIGALVLIPALSHFLLRDVKQRGANAAPTAAAAHAT
ncbi:RND transporter [Variovorax sp. WS11]|uniref:efflux RND transporter permease subunit n=1 Tax=Variovorax sp. WS11 TaxID=1105204 RepID=UPI000D0DED03|nr:MMPL family transporter [Variovorax sp. WS11]NDZ18630.1 MMPL family transporter [Variovorax sp. WS11]PSL83585.1 RND transporter [Variovorax sp. WS11]